MGERHEAVVARAVAERLAGAESAGGEVNRVGAAMTVCPPPMLEDSAFRICAGDFWCVEVSLRWGVACGRVALSGEDEWDFRGCFAAACLVGRALLLLLVGVCLGRGLGNLNGCDGVRGAGLFECSEACEFRFEVSFLEGVKARE